MNETEGDMLEHARVASEDIINASEQDARGSDVRQDETFLTAEQLQGTNTYSLGKNEIVVLTPREIQRLSATRAHYSMPFETPSGEARKLPVRLVMTVIVGAPSESNAARLFQVVDDPDSMVVSLEVSSERPPINQILTDVTKGGDPLVIGREVFTGDILADTVSRRHCAVGLYEGGFVVQNLNPTNDTVIR